MKDNEHWHIRRFHHCRLASGRSMMPEELFLGFKKETAANKV
jgi:hypothetical protein